MTKTVRVSEYKWMGDFLVGVMFGIVMWVAVTGVTGVSGIGAISQPACFYDWQVAGACGGDAVNTSVLTPVVADNATFWRCDWKNWTVRAC